MPMPPLQSSSHINSLREINSAIDSFACVIVAELLESAQKQVLCSSPFLFSPMQSHDC